MIWIVASVTVLAVVGWFYALSWYAKARYICRVPGAILAGLANKRIVGGHSKQSEWQDALRGWIEAGGAIAGTPPKARKRRAPEIVDPAMGTGAHLANACPVEPYQPNPEFTRKTDPPAGVAGGVD